MARARRPNTAPRSKRALPPTKKSPAERNTRIECRSFHSDDRLLLDPTDLAPRKFHLQPAPAFGEHVQFDPGGQPIDETRRILSAVAALKRRVILLDDRQR